MTQRYSHLAMEDLEETVGLLSSGLSTREDRLTQQLEVLTRQVAALGALVGREVLPG